MAGNNQIIRPQQYYFTGTPEAIRAGADSHAATTQAEAAVRGAQYQTQSNLANARANVAQANVSAPVGLYGAYAAPAANMFGTLGNMYNTGIGTLGQMFDSYADAFSAYGGAIGNIAGNASQARANENAGRYAAYAGGLDAYSGMLGNLGSAALAGYGSAANAAMQSAAMRESAAFKAMSDMVGSNQAALSQYGAGRDASLANVANAYANAAGGTGMARANLAGAAANLGGAGSAALAGLGTGVADAAANAAAGTAQGQAALSAAIAQALGFTSSSQANALAQNNASANDALAGITNAASNANAGLGGATANLTSNLGSNFTDAAANTLAFTRDTGKLDLARLLGLTSSNVASQGLSGIGGIGGIGGGGGFTITGPEGVIAEATGGGFSSPGVGGSGAPPIFTDPNTNLPWYSQRQSDDGGAMAALAGLQAAGFGSLGNLGSAVGSDASAARGQSASQTAAAQQAILAAGDAGRSGLASESAAGRGTIQAALDAAMGRINAEGAEGRQAILANLAANNDVIRQQGAGLDADASTALTGIQGSQDAITGSGLLDSLNNNFRGGYDSLMSAYESGRQDPRQLLQDVYSGTQGLLSPLLGMGGNAYNNWSAGFPEPLDPALGGSGFLDPVPYLAALQAGWSPFRSELGNAFYNQNANVLGALQSGRMDYYRAADTLGGLYDSAAGDVANLVDAESDSFADQIRLPDQDDKRSRTVVYRVGNPQQQNRPPSTGRYAGVLRNTGR